MIKNLHVLVFIILMGMVGSAKAQDIHFSQFYMSPLNLNPALTGVMNCNVRLVANYRNQWSSVMGSNAFNTYAVSYDQKMTVGRYDYFGFGLNLWADRAGESHFTTMSGKISGSYSKRMGGYRDRSHFLVAGVDVGLSQRSINFDLLKWGLQNNLGEWDPSKSSGEFFQRDAFFFGDFSAGLLWFSNLDKKNSFYLGAAFSHLNRPNQSFNKAPGSEDLIYSKLAFHGGGEFALSDNVSVVPGIVTFFQGPSFELNFGSALRFLLNEDRFTKQSFQVGAWMRLANNYKSALASDALILSARFDYNTFALGFSYDFNISSLKAASRGNGAFELALHYLICGPERRGVYCPNF